MWELTCGFYCSPSSNNKLEFAKKQRVNHSRLLTSYFIFWGQIHEIRFLEWSQSPCPITSFLQTVHQLRMRRAFPQLRTETKSLGREELESIPTMTWPQEFLEEMGTVEE